jgi:hypothetical protein
LSGPTFSRRCARPRGRASDHEASDPLEVLNLAADPAHGKTVMELEALLEERWKESLQ